MMAHLDIPGLAAARPRRMLSWKSAVGALLVFVAFLAFWGPSALAFLRLHTAAYFGDRYAFYTDTGDVFYGVVLGAGPSSVILTDTYSFQTVSVGETTTSNLRAQTANPLTSPDNWLVLAWDRIVFYERIGDDASVLEAIRPSR